MRKWVNKNNEKKNSLIKIDFFANIDKSGNAIKPSSTNYSFKNISYETVIRMMKTQKLQAILMSRLHFYKRLKFLK